MGSPRFGEWLLPVAGPQRPQAAPHCAALCPAACCPPCIRTLAALHLRLTAPPTFCCISADAAASALLLSHGRRSRCWHRGLRNDGGRMGQRTPRCRRHCVWLQSHRPFFARSSQLPAVLLLLLHASPPLAAVVSRAQPQRNTTASAPPQQQHSSTAAQHNSRQHPPPSLSLSQPLHCRVVLLALCLVSALESLHDAEP